MTDMFSIDSIVATRRGLFISTYRGLKPTAKVTGPLRGQAVADLTTAADAFEASFSNTASATAEHVAVTVDEAAKVRAGMVIVRILDGIVRNRYAIDPGKLTAWISASRVEKAPKKKEPTR
jgi:hypothetical protein